MIDYPVRLNDEQTIVDAKNHVVLPMCWKNDLDHVQRQEKLGLLIVELLNGQTSMPDTAEQAIPLGSRPSTLKLSVSERMKKYWAERKAKEKVTA